MSPEPGLEKESLPGMSTCWGRVVGLNLYSIVKRELVCCILARPHSFKYHFLPLQQTEENGEAVVEEELKNGGGAENGNDGEYEDGGSSSSSSRSGPNSRPNSSLNHKNQDHQKNNHSSDINLSGPSSPVAATATVAGPTHGEKSRPPPFNTTHTALHSSSSSSSSSAIATNAQHHHHHHKPGSASGGGREGVSIASSDVPSAIKLLVSAGLAGCLIGKGGSTINDLQERTGARIKLSQNQDYFPGTQDRIVLISGDAETCTHAAVLVIEHLHSSAQARTAAAAAAAGSNGGGSEEKEEPREVGADREGEGMERGGDEEGGVEEEHQPPAEEPSPSQDDQQREPRHFSPTSPSPPPPPFSSSPPPLPHAPTNSSTSTTSVKLLIAKGAGGLVIGRAGATIKALNEESGARIQLAAKDEAAGVVTGERVVTISGPLKGVVKGVSRILEKLNEEPELARYQNLTTSYSRSTSAAHPLHPAFDIPTYHTQSFGETQTSFSPGGPGGAGSGGRGGGMGVGSPHLHGLTHSLSMDSSHSSHGSGGGGGGGRGGGGGYVPPALPLQSPLSAHTSLSSHGHGHAHAHAPHGIHVGGHGHAQFHHQHQQQNIQHQQRQQHSLLHSHSHGGSGHHPLLHQSHPHAAHAPVPLHGGRGGGGGGGGGRRGEGGGRYGHAHNSPSHHPQQPQHVLHHHHQHPPSSNSSLLALQQQLQVQQFANTTLTLQVPDKLIGSILGKSGATLKKLQSQSGARITISKRGEYAPGTQNRVVAIDGPVHCAEVARGMITTTVQQASMSPPPGSY